MFDDLKQSSSNQKDDILPEENKQSESAGELAMEVPKKPVADMFGDIDPVADKGSALQSGKMQEISNTSDPSPMAVSQDLQIEQVSFEKDGSAKIKTIAAMVISVLFLAGIATVAYSYFVKNKDNAGDVIIASTDEEIADDVTNDEIVDEDIVDDVTNDEIIDEEIVDESKLDFDGDGLSNGEEEALGTDPLEPDTDNDGIFDWDEVELYKSDPLETDTDGDELNDYDEIRVWGTDPNQVDTDNDGFGDGVEVINGYNPFGEGDIEDFIPIGQRITE